MKKIKVGIIGIRGLPANYGAFDQFESTCKIFNKIRKIFSFHIFRIKER